MAETAQFAATPRLEEVLITTANTNRDGTGTIGQVFIGGTSGSRLERVRIKATGNTSAGMVRMYTYNVAGTPTYALYQEVSVTAITAGTTTQTFSADILLGTAVPLFLPSGRALGFSTAIGEPFLVTVIGGDL